MKKINARSNYHFCFRQWRNAPYAMFNSLGKKVKIGALSIAYVLGGFLSESKAQTDTITAQTGTLEDVTVSALRKKFNSIPGKVITTITKDEINNSAVHSIQDLLESVTAVDVRSRGENGVQADINIRGGNPDQVLILLNGINITDPQTGHYNLNIPVNLDDIDRIEILQGPGARVLGPNAFSGAINIITGENKQKQLRASLTGGQYGYVDGTLSGSLVKNAFSMGASASLNRSDGYIHNTDFNTGNYFLQMQYNNAKSGKINFQSSYQNKAYGANSFYSPAFLEQYEYLHTILSSLSWNKQFNKLNIDVSVYWRRNYDRYELIKDSSYGRNFHRTDVTGAQVKAIYYSALGRTTLGADLNNQKIISTLLGTPLGNPTDVDFAKGIVPLPKYTQGDERTSINLILDHTYIKDNFSISGGLLYSWNSKFNNFLLGGVDGSYKISPSMQLFAGINQSMRLPTFTDLYYKGPGYEANINLKPEYATTYETGIKYNRNKFSGYISGYYRHGKDIIDWLKSPSTGYWKSNNITVINTTGIELSGQYAPENIFIKKIKAGLNWQTMDKNSQDLISKYELDYLKLKAGLSLEHNIIKNLSANWRFTYQERAGNYEDYKTGVKTDYQPFSLIDVRVMYSRPHYSVLAECSNLLNSTYLDFGNIEMPGRWLKMGLSVKI